MKQSTSNKVWIVLCVLIVLISLVVTPVMAAELTEVNWYMSGGGGGVATDGIYTLNGTIGQPVTGLDGSADIDVCSSFWCKVLEHYRIFLPLTLKQ
jgi:hypothetical protein